MDPAKYKSIANGVKLTIAEEGTRALGKGWAPTAIGYSMQVRPPSLHLLLRPVLSDGR